MRSRTENSIKNIFSGLILKILLLVLQFATKTIFVKYLSDYLGLNALITSLLSYLNIAELGISTAINFAMYKPIADEDQEKVKQYLAYYRKVYHYIGLAVFIIGICMSFFLPLLIKTDDLPFDFQKIYFIYFLYLINVLYPYFCFAHRGGFIAASQEDYRLAPFNYTASIGAIIIQAVVLVALKGSFYSFVLYTAAPIVLSIFRSIANGLFAAKWYPYIRTKPEGKLSKPEIRDLYHNVFGISIARICTIINNSIDSIVITFFIGIKILGYYSLYNTIIGMVVGFVNIIFSSLIPSVGNLNASSDTHKKKEIFDTINFAAFWIYGVTAICFLNAVQPFMELWAGSDKVLSMMIPVVVSLNYLTNGMISSVSIFREGCGLYYKAKYRPIFSTLVNIVFSVALAQILTVKFGADVGLFGVLIATIISRMAVIWWYDAWIVFKNVFFESPRRYLIQFLVRFVFVVAIWSGTFALCCLIPSHINKWALVVIRIAISLIISSVVLLLTYRKKPEFRYLVNMVKRIFLKITKKKTVQ